MPPAKSHYRVAIVGSGPAGWTAALYAGRAELSPVVFKGTQPGGQLSITSDVENYPGLPPIHGPKMMDIFEAQAVRFGAESVFDVVTDMDFSARPFRLSLDSGMNMTADAVIVATGASARKLGPELDPGTGNYRPGTSACATCDGPLPAYRGKEIAVVGGGDTAMEEATFLTRYASRVTVIHRREEFRASKIMLDRARAHPKIAWRLNETIEAIDGGPQGLNSITVRDTRTGARARLPMGGLFVAIGHDPNTTLFRGKLAMNEAGYLTIDHPSTRTSVEGVFAAGDVADPTYRQAISAAGEGCKAAIDAERWLAAKGIH